MARLCAWVSMGSGAGAGAGVVGAWGVLCIQDGATRNAVPSVPLSCCQVTPVHGLPEPPWTAYEDLLGDNSLFADVSLVRRVADLVGVQV
jgi:hypothetical protein